MKTLHHSFSLQTPAKASFHDVTGQIKNFVLQSGIKEGIIIAYSQHTTCSIIIQEESHDTIYDGTEFLMQDLLDVFETIIPKCRRERQYMHPGPLHIEHAVNNLGEEAIWSLNTEAHLRSVMMGRSEALPVVNGELQLGEFGKVYFVDFDGTRTRERTVRFHLIGE